MPNDNIVSFPDIEKIVSDLVEKASPTLNAIVAGIKQIATAVIEKVEKMDSTVVTTQGIAWDQIALDKIGSEKQMGCLFAPNVEEADALFFSGGVRIKIPDVRPQAVKNLPPWERM